MTATNGLRLLPWSSPEGKPCFLSTDSGSSRLSRRADEVEDLQLSMGAELLGHAHALLNERKADVREVRFLAERLCEALGATLCASQRAGANACPHTMTMTMPTRRAKTPSGCGRARPDRSRRLSRAGAHAMRPGALAGR